MSANARSSDFPFPYAISGGAIEPGDPSYVTRRADDELFEGLRRGEYCYVLTPRQMGKTSLMVRVATRLREAGTAVALIDLTSIGHNLDVEQWYTSLRAAVGEELDLDRELAAFWREHAELPPLDRLKRAIRDVVLERCPRPVVIFIDEIDYVRPLPFSTDEFFAAIRACFNDRARDPRLRRLTFCMLGTVTPAELIQDPRSTPFNIGRRIELNDFTRDEAARLAWGLSCDRAKADRLMDRIYHWTGGQPYLTQSLCHAVAQNPEIDGPSGVDRVCADLFFTEHARRTDKNLQFAGNYLTLNQAEDRRAALLDLYAKVRDGRQIRDDETNPLHGALRLSGLVRVVDGILRIRNRIYNRVFGRSWIRENLPDAEVRRQRAAFRRGVFRTGSVAAFVIAGVLLGALLFFHQYRRAEKAEQAQIRAREETERVQMQAEQAQIWSQIWSLLNAEPVSVPTILKSLDQSRSKMMPHLRDLQRQTDLPEKARVRVNLALLPSEPGLIDPLKESLLKADPQEFWLIREVLLPYGKTWKEDLWKLVEKPEIPKDRRLNAVCALALYDPNDPRWNRNSVVEVLNHPSLGEWMEALRPAQHALLAPLINLFTKSSEPDVRNVVMKILSEFEVDQVDDLVDLITTDPFIRPKADQKTRAKWKQKWVAPLKATISKLRVHIARAINRLNSVLDKEGLPTCNQGDSRVIPEDDRDALARRQANVALALLCLGKADRVWPLLGHTPDPRLRTYLINQIGPLGVDPQVLIARLNAESDASTRRALILALGEYPDESLLSGSRESLVNKLLRTYRDDPDPGIHAAIDWLLRLCWELGGEIQQIDEQMASQRPKDNRLWYVNRQEQTLAVVRGPVEFQMGSPDYEVGRESDEDIHSERINRTFAIASKETTVKQFLRFRPEHLDSKRSSPKPDEQPITEVSWYQAAQYCRWLSEQEGISEDQMCFPPVDEIGPSMTLPPNYLSRTGYRLPTEAEWEFACRAGATTCRPYGNDPRMLPNYAWYASFFSIEGHEHAERVGLLKPNDLGLFDALGNVGEWCMDWYAPYTSRPDGRFIEELQFGESGKNRVFRGGSFLSVSSKVRCASRHSSKSPETTYNSVGFRVARTLP